MSLADRCIDLDPGYVYYISTFWHDDSIDSPRCCIRRTIDRSEFSTRFNFWLRNVFKFSCLSLSSKRLKESFCAIILALSFSQSLKQRKIFVSIEIPRNWEVDLFENIHFRSVKKSTYLRIDPLHSRGDSQSLRCPMLQLQWRARGDSPCLC